MEQTPPFDTTPQEGAQPAADVATSPPSPPSPPAKDAKEPTAVQRSLALVRGTVKEFDAIEAGLAKLQKKYGNVVFDVSTTKGMAEACKARMDVRDPRYALKKALDAAKAPLNALKADITARADYITAEILKIETPIHEQIQAEEKRKADEKEARETANRARILAITERIAAIRSTGSRAGACRTSERVAAIRDTLEATDMTGFEEFEAEAIAALEGAKLTVGTILTNKLADEEAAAKEKADREAEALRLAEEQEKVAAAQKKLDDERAELDRQRAEFAALQAAIPAAVSPEKQELAIAIANGLIAEAVNVASVTGCAVIADGQVHGASQVYKQPTYCCETGEALGLDGVACPQCSDTSAAYSADMRRNDEFAPQWTSEELAEIASKASDPLSFNRIGVDLAGGPDVGTVTEVKYMPGDPSTHAAQLDGYEFVTGVAPSLPIDIAQADPVQDPTDEELMTVVIDAVSGYFGMSEQQAMHRLSAIKTWLYEGSPLSA